MRLHLQVGVGSAACERVLRHRAIVCPRDERLRGAALRLVDNGIQACQITPRPEVETRAVGERRTESRRIVDARSRQVVAVVYLPARDEVPLAAVLDLLDPRQHRTGKPLHNRRRSERRIRKEVHQIGHTRISAVACRRNTNKPRSDNTCCRIYETCRHQGLLTVFNTGLSNVRSARRRQKYAGPGFNRN
jgi:hypothetical protein